MSFKPIFDRVLAREIDDTQVTEGGIAISRQNENVKRAKVLAMGEGMWEDGTFVEMKVKIGDTVLFEEHCCVPFFDNGKKFVLIKQTDILAIEEDK